MRNNTVLGLIITILCFVLTGCTSSSEETQEIIKVYDYKNIYVSEDYLELSDQDIESIIYMDFASKDNYEMIDKREIEEEDVILLTINSSDELYDCSKYYYEVGLEDISEYLDRELVGKDAFDEFEITIEINGKSVVFKIKVEGIYVLKDTKNEKNILEFYECDTVEEAESFIRKRAENEIVFNYMWEKIKENSYFIQIPKFIEKEISNEISLLSNQASKTGETLDAYLDELGVTVESIKQNKYNYYFELILAETILSKENVIINDDLKSEYKNKQAKENNLSIEELENYFSDEDVHYGVVMQELEKVLVSYINIE